MKQKPGSDVNEYKPGSQTAQATVSSQLFGFPLPKVPLGHRVGADESAGQ